jgi:hypothetical protein
MPVYGLLREALKARKISNCRLQDVSHDAEVISEVITVSLLLAIMSKKLTTVVSDL